MAKEVTFKLNLKIDGKDVVKRLTVDVNELQRAIGETRSYTDRLTGSLVKFNQISEMASSFSGALSQMASTLNTVTAESRRFGGAMAAANTMAGKNGEEMSALKSQVSDLSKTIPIARDELANGLYQVISNGVPEDNWISYLEQSAKASVGGIADLGETVKVTSTIIKNYRLAWDQAGNVQDKIQLTAKNGVTSFEQLAQALPRVTSNAANLGVSVDELMAAFSTLTGVSGNTAEVSTQLAAIFTALINPSSEATEMAQQMGIQFDAAAIKAAGGLQQFLVSLDKSVKQYAASSGVLEQEVYGKLFGSAESLRAITPLTNQLADKFKENVAGMQNSAGTIDDAFNTMASTGSATLQILNNKLGEYTDIIQSSIGNVGPYLNAATQISMMGASIVTLGSTFRQLATSTKVATAAVTAYNAAAGIALGLSTAPLVAMAAALGVLAVGYSNVKSRMEDTDREARALRETLADMKKKQDDNVAAIRQYLPIAQDATRSVKDRRDAIIKLKNLYPEYFKNLDIASSKQYNIEKAVNAANRAYRNQLVLIAKQAKMKYEESKANYEKNQGGAMMTGTNPGMNVMMNQQEKAEVEANLKLWKEAEKAVTDYDKALNKASGNRTQPTGNNTPAKPKATPVGQMNYQQVADAIEKTTNKLKGATPGSKEAQALDAYNKKLLARKKILEQTYSSLNTNKSSGTKKEPKFYKNPVTSEQLDKNINYYSGKLTSKNTAEDQKIRKQIQLWKEKKAAIDLANLAAERPLKLDSKGAYEKDISVLQQMVSLTVDPDAAKKLQTQLEAEQRELGMLKVKIGIDQIPKVEVKKALQSIPQQIDEILKNFGQNFKPIEIKPEFQVKREDQERIQSLFNIDASSFSGVQNAMENISAITDSTAKGFASAGAGCQILGSALQQLGADSAAAKAGMVMAAIGQLVLSFSQAMVSASSNWITWLAFGVSGTAQLISIISTMSQFASGGIVGGNQKSGDKVMVRVNSGEMILNAAQQARLFALANGAAVQGISTQTAMNVQPGMALPQVTVQTGKLQGLLASDDSAPRQIDVRLKVRGRDIVAAAANETRSNRRRSNIKI